MQVVGRVDEQRVGVDVAGSCVAPLDVAVAGGAALGLDRAAIVAGDDVAVEDVVGQNDRGVITRYVLDAPPIPPLG